MLRPGSWCALHVLISHQKPLRAISVHARCKRGRQHYHAFHYLIFLLCFSCSELPKNWQMQAQVQIQQRRWLGKSWLPSLSPGLAYCHLIVSPYLCISHLHNAAVPCTLSQTKHSPIWSNLINAHQSITLETKLEFHCLNFEEIEARICRWRCCAQQPLFAQFSNRNKISIYHGTVVLGTMVRVVQLHSPEWTARLSFMVRRNILFYKGQTW